MGFNDVNEFSAVEKEEEKEGSDGESICFDVDSDGELEVRKRVKSEEQTP